MTVTHIDNFKSVLYVQMGYGARAYGHKGIKDRVEDEVEIKSYFAVDPLRH